MRFLLILNFSFLILNCALGQVELVDVRNPVYGFLKRMQLKEIIPDYNSSAIPVSRGQVGKYLTVIKKNQNLLTATDKAILRDYEVEFEYDMTGTTKDQVNLFTESGMKNLFSRSKQKHIYFNADSANTFFGDFTGAMSFRSSSGDSIGDNSILLGAPGIQVRGTFRNSVAYFLALGKGYFSNADDSDIFFAAETDPMLKGNYSFVNEKKNFNSFEGYLRYQTKGDWLALTFGKAPLNFGFGYIDKLFMSNNSVPFSFGNLNLKYKALNYSFTYGSIDGDSVGVYPYYSARPLSSKNIATHNLNISFSDAFNVGLWESIIISNQPFSFTYFNPISFLTSADLSSGKEKTEENNALLGIETEIIPFRNFSFQGTLLIDDLTLGELWKTDSLNENKFGWQFGALWTNEFNMNLSLEYTHLDPFVYSHRSNKSTYTNHLMSMGHALPPNSDEIAFKFDYDISNKLKLILLYQHQRSGEGIIVDSSGMLKANYGGNINFGLGDAYLRTNRFLDGTRINRDIFTADFVWQPYKQFYLKGKFRYMLTDNITDDFRFNDTYYFATFGIDL